MSVRLLPALSVTLLVAACDGAKDDTPVVDTDDTDVPVDTDLPDLDNTFATATSVDVPLSADTVVDLLGDDALLAPRKDIDVYSLTLQAGTAYQLWVDAREDLLCDMVLRVYGPNGVQLTNDETRDDLGASADGVLAVADDMPARMRESDPGMVLVPLQSGVHHLEVLGYAHARFGADEATATGCPYRLMAKQRAAHDDTTQEDGALRPVTLLEPDATCPNLFLDLVDDTDVDEPTGPVTPQGVPALLPNWPQAELVDSDLLLYADELSGWLESDADDDVWRYSFGTLEGRAGGHFWLFSLWQTLPNSAATYEQRPYALTLYDDRFQVLAFTDRPVPDGNYGFTEDAGILYPVESNTTYYLRVSRADAPVPQICGGSEYDPDPGDTDVPDTDTDTDTDVPDTDTDVPDTDTDVPDTDLPDTDTDVPDTDTDVTDTDTDDPDTDPDTDVPDTDVPDTDLPPDTSDTDGTGETGADTDVPDTDALPDTDGTGDSAPPASPPAPIDTTDSALPTTAWMRSDPPLAIGWSPAPAAPDDQTYYLGFAYGYGNKLVGCGDDATLYDAARWTEKEPNGDLATAQNLLFCAVPGTDLFVARKWGRVAPVGQATLYRRPGETGEVDTDTDTPPQVEFDCGAENVCPDREVFSIDLSSEAGGALGGRKLTVSVQAASVGSYLRPEVFIFDSADRIRPLASSYDEAERSDIHELTDDPVIETVLPSTVGKVFIMIQAVDQHPTQEKANTWFLRAFLEPAD